MAALKMAAWLAARFQSMYRGDKACRRRRKRAKGPPQAIFFLPAVGRGFEPLRRLAEHHHPFLLFFSGPYWCPSYSGRSSSGPFRCFSPPPPPVVAAVVVFGVFLRRGRRLSALAGFFAVFLFPLWCREISGPLLRGAHQLPAGVEGSPRGAGCGAAPHLKTARPHISPRPHR